MSDSLTGIEAQSVPYFPRVPCYSREVTVADYICDPLVLECDLDIPGRNTRIFLEQLNAFATWHFAPDHFKITEEWLSGERNRIVKYRLMGFKCLGDDQCQAYEAEPNPTGDAEQLWCLFAYQIRRQCPGGAKYNRPAPLKLRPWMDWGISSSK